MSWWARYKLWFHVCETGGSWFVERDGRTVALLTDPHFVDMFWYAWHLEPLVENFSERAAIMSKEYWNDEFLLRTVFRSREYGTAAGGFWAGEPIREGRLVMRALYQPIREPWPWESFIMWLRAKA